MTSTTHRGLKCERGEREGGGERERKGANLYLIQGRSKFIKGKDCGIHIKGEGREGGL